MTIPDRPLLEIRLAIDYAARARVLDDAVLDVRSGYRTGGAPLRPGIPAPLSGRSQCRPGATRADRDGDSAQPGFIDRRRAHQLVGRDLASRGTGLVRAPEPRARNGHPLYLARP